MAKPRSPARADLRLVQFDTDLVSFRWLDDGEPIDPPDVDHYVLFEHYDLPGYILEVPLSVDGGLLTMNPTQETFAVPGYYMFEIERVDGANRSTSPTYGPLNAYVRDDISNAPISSSMTGSTATIDEATDDTEGAPIGAVAAGATVMAFRDGEPVASTVSTDGTFELGVVPGSSYTVYVHFPGTYALPRTFQL